MADLAIYQADNEDEDDLLRAARDMTPQTPSESIWALLLAQSEPEGLLHLIAQRTQIPVERLYESRRQLRDFRELLPTSAPLRLAMELLRLAYADGLYLTLSPGGSWSHFVRTHWETLPEPLLRQMLARLALRNPMVYGGDTGPVVSSALRLLRDLQVRTPPDTTPQPVINTRSGEVWIGADGLPDLRPHRPESHLRHVLPMSYDEAAVCPEFDHRIYEIFAASTDPRDMVRHVTEIMGYAIQPRRHIPSIIMFRGGGANGKSTVVDLIIGLVGMAQTYTGSISSLGDRFNLPDLQGKLVCLDRDLGEGDRLDDGFLKKISENNPITARRVRASHGEQFISTVLPILLTNGTPRLPDSSHGFERRLRCVPFNRRFTKDDEVEGLAKSLIDAELPGILNRALQGLRRLMERGHFQDPVDCRRDRQALMAAANPLLGFIDEMCLRSPEAREDATVFYNAFRDWCAYQHLAPGFGRQGLKSRIESMGLTIRRTNSQTVLVGLSLRRSG